MDDLHLEDEMRNVSHIQRYTILIPDDLSAKLLFRSQSTDDLASGEDIPCPRHSRPTPQKMSDKMRNNSRSSKYDSKSAHGVPGWSQSSVVLTALYLLSDTATVADRATRCSYTKRLTRRMAADRSVVFKMETKGAVVPLARRSNPSPNTPPFLLETM